LYKSSHFGKLFYVYATDIPECSTICLVTLFFTSENLVQSEKFEMTIISQSIYILRVISFTRVSILVILAWHFMFLATGIPECATMYLITLSFALENMVQSEEF
jgi:hypothetical protein